MGFSGQSESQFPHLEGLLDRKKSCGKPKNRLLYALPAGVQFEHAKGEHDEKEQAERPTARLPERARSRTRSRSLGQEFAAVGRAQDEDWQEEFLQTQLASRLAGFPRKIGRRVVSKRPRRRAPSAAGKSMEREEVSLDSKPTNDGKQSHEVRLPDGFWRRATHLSMEAKALYAVLITFADYRTGLTFVGNPRLQLETNYGRDLVKRLLRELELECFIERRREIKKNLKSKRWIKCLKYVVTDRLNFSPSARWTGFRAAEDQPTISTPVKSSVTSNKQSQNRLYPTQDHSVLGGPWHCWVFQSLTRNPKESCD